MILGGKTFAWLHDTNGVHQVQAWFIRHYTATAMFCGVGFVIWLLLWFQRTGRFRLFPVLVVLLLGDLLWFDHGRCVQCDSSLYYPPIPALDQIAQSAPGRIIGNQCLPASLAIMEGLKDIRGYDAIDPKRMVDLLKTAAVPGTTPVYAATQLLVPKGTIKSPGTIQLTPVMDMLDVRYIIFRGMPPPDIHPAFQSPDYWVLINSNALPRAFVPTTAMNWKNCPRRNSGRSTPRMLNRPSICRLPVAARRKLRMKFRRASQSPFTWKRPDSSCWPTGGTKAGTLITTVSRCQFFRSIMPFAASLCRRVMGLWNLSINPRA
jgi:hypothetical protein